MKVSKSAIDYIKQELDDHNWSSYKIRKWFGRVYIDFKKSHDADGIIQWENMIHDSRHSLGFYLKRISHLRIEMIPAYSKEYTAYSKAIDDSCIFLSDEEQMVASLFSYSLKGFKKIKQTKEGSVFVFNSKENMFQSLSPLRSFISTMRKIPLEKICMFSGGSSVLFHTTVKDTRPSAPDPIEELQSF